MAGGFKDHATVFKTECMPLLRQLILLAVHNFNYECSCNALIEMSPCKARTFSFLSPTTTYLNYAARYFTISCMHNGKLSETINPVRISHTPKVSGNAPLRAHLCNCYSRFPPVTRGGRIRSRRRLCNSYPPSHNIIIPRLCAASSPFAVRRSPFAGAAGFGVYSGV